MEKFTSIRNIAEPIRGGFWGEESENPNAKIIRNGDILEDGTIRNSAPLRFLNVNELSKSKVFNGDILMTVSGNVGRVAKVAEDSDETGIPYVASNFVKIIRISNPQFNPLFVFYFFKSHLFKNAILKHTRGVAIQNLSTKVFDEKIVPVLPIEKQNNIAIFLERIESLKQKQLEVDKKMDTLVLSLFVKIFSDQSYPKDKIVNLINDKYSIRTGPFGSQLHHDEFTENGIPVLGIDNVVKNKFRWTVKRCLPEEKFKKFSRFKVYPGDVLVTIMGTVGRVVVAPVDLPECMSTKHLCVITTNKSILNPVYLWASLLFDRNVRHQTKNVANGAIMEGWNSTIIKNLVISLPPIELQNKFADLVKEIEIQKDKQRKSTQKVEELFSAVMVKFFS